VYVLGKDNAKKQIEKSARSNPQSNLTCFFPAEQLFNRNQNNLPTCKYNRRRPHPPASFFLYLHRVDKQQLGFEQRNGRKINAPVWPLRSMARVCLCVCVRNLFSADAAALLLVSNELLLYPCTYFCLAAPRSPQNEA
jgi:hypothetical protein